MRQLSVITRHCLDFWTNMLKCVPKQLCLILESPGFLRTWNPLRLIAEKQKGNGPETKIEYHKLRNEYSKLLNFCRCSYHNNVIFNSSGNQKKLFKIISIWPNVIKTLHCKSTLTLLNWQMIFRTSMFKRLTWSGRILKTSSLVIYHILCTIIQMLNLITSHPLLKRRLGTS